MGESLYAKFDEVNVVNKIYQHTIVHSYIGHKNQNKDKQQQRNWKKKMTNTDSIKNKGIKTQVLTKFMTLFMFPLVKPC